ncbi:bifunctional diaminohydroxyphosphoribosylaminopyrimidine deaminase/5-amino-6-(5-phosphoribosylamino)uracil reductase RibD [Roseibium sp.]|uniref:bifunctional diaminohydroxyphosphoribosylaminopyrimidine deaminase/5-amino-6-(5-phosphoribosylamino)uracil reductase RibD n=1 Tax=Roseibium sp. TaxID=1936156 RepID=UPI003A97E567
MTHFAQQDSRFMLAAVGLARRGLGKVWPNPSVGALIVGNNERGEPVVVGRGVTSRPGSAHAEVNALRQAGSRARGATCYVTLEPCSHFGRTPPCSNALIEAGVARVVIGMRDPNPRVAGRGIKMLQDAGVDVLLGVEEAECRALHHGFSLRISEQRPHVFLKLAVSKDGFIGREGEGQIMISGPLSMRHVHGFRANHDAILVGIGTALADDPMLTCRLPGMADRSPVRVVLDARARLPVTSAMVKGAADVPMWVIVGNDADTGRVKALSEAGALVIRIPLENGRINPRTALRALGARGVTRLMVEGGSRIASAFLIADCVDDLCIVTGDVEIGAGGIPPLQGTSLEDILADPRYERIDRGHSGRDTYVYLRKRA